MRSLFRVLLLLNVLAFGLIQVVDGRAVAGAHDAQREIAPDKITLLPPGTPLLPARAAATAPAATAPAATAPAATAPAPAAPPSPSLCLQWTGFDAPSARQAAERLATLALGNRVEERQEPLRHWVFIPPLKNRAEAERKLREFQARGVRDLHVARNNAISLGLFSSEEGADRRLAQLKKQGVVSALATPLDTDPESAFVIRDADEAAAARIAAWAADFPRAHLSSAPCPTSLAAAAASH